MIRHPALARPHKQTGFTVVELVLTVVAFGFISAAIGTLFLSIQGIQRRTAYLETATRTANKEVEALRNNNYNLLTTGTTIDFTSQVPTTLPAPRSGTVNITEPVPGIKRVDVTVSYTDHGDQQKIELSSLIGVIGISQ